MTIKGNSYLYGDDNQRPGVKSKGYCPSPDRSGYPTAGPEGLEQMGLAVACVGEGRREEYERRAG